MSSASPAPKRRVVLLVQGNPHGLNGLLCGGQQWEVSAVLLWQFAARPWWARLRINAFERACRAAKVPYTRFAADDFDAVRQWLIASRATCAISFEAPILPAALFNALPDGIYNLHPSRLPEYPGGMPLLWAIADGHPEQAMTLSRMTDKIDQGQIQTQWPWTIPAQGTEYERIQSGLKTVASPMLRWALDHWPQPDLRAAKAQSNRRYAARINVAQLPQRIDLALHTPAQCASLLALFETLPWAPTGLLRLICWRVNGHYTQQPLPLAHFAWARGRLWLGCGQGRLALSIQRRLGPWRRHLLGLIRGA